MARFFSRSTFLAAASAFVAALLCAPEAHAKKPAAHAGACPTGYHQTGYGYLALNTQTCNPRGYGRPDLFYNFYVPGRCGGYPAEMYPAPIPTPPIVGHVYYTYQPFMPHEMMYRHSRHYYNFYDYGRGLNHTTVRWW
jgi:hypothetical protein